MSKIAYTKNQAGSCLMQTCRIDCNCACHYNGTAYHRTVYTRLLAIGPAGEYVFFLEFHSTILAMSILINDDSRFRDLLFHQWFLGLSRLDNHFVLRLLRPILCSSLSFLLVLPYDPLVLGITSQDPILTNC
jgi:hypothetical protein